MEQMNADAAVLAREANNFERISGEIKAIIAQVEGTAGSLAREWQGQHGAAAQSALERFREAATRQVHELNGILGDFHNAGVQYPPTIAEQITTL